jgi:AcrR family transcriptional regulator
MTAYWQSDPADVSVNAICQMAGISKPSLYREFGSEDGLTRAVLDSYAERVLSDVFAILQAGGAAGGRSQP